MQQLGSPNSSTQKSKILRSFDGGNPEPPRKLIQGLTNCKLWCKTRQISEGDLSNTKTPKNQSIKRCQRTSGASPLKSTPNFKCPRQGIGGSWFFHSKSPFLRRWWFQNIPWKEWVFEEICENSRSSPLRAHHTTFSRKHTQGKFWQGIGNRLKMEHLVVFSLDRQPIP